MKQNDEEVIDMNDINEVNNENKKIV